MCEYLTLVNSTVPKGGCGVCVWWRIFCKLTLTVSVPKVKVKVKGMLCVLETKKRKGGGASYISKGTDFVLGNLWNGL